jgi:hypothetical protein
MRAIFVGLALAALCEEQANCSEITSEVDLIGGCFSGITDLEKSNEPHKMLAQATIPHGPARPASGRQWQEVEREVYAGDQSCPTWLHLPATA